MAKKEMSPESFREKLQGILELAEKHGGKITRGEAEDFFSEEQLSEEQMALVFDFLLSRKVAVEGYIKQEEAPAQTDPGELPWSAEEQHWLELYEEDLAQIRPADAGEIELLLEKAGQGQAAAKRRLSELFLPEVCETAKRMYRPGVILSDIIQEASLELVLFVEALEELLPADIMTVRNALDGEIRRSIQALIEEQKDVHTRDRKMVSRVRDFKDAVTELKEDLGRKVYLDEIADYLHITEEEAEDILKLAGEDVPEEEE